MFANYCRWCDIGWPYHVPLKADKCPICDERTTAMQTEISDDWKERLAEHRLREEHSLDPFVTVTGVLRQEGKQYLLSTHDVVNSGIHHRLLPDTVIRLRNEEGAELFVEVLGYSYQGRVYHVRLFQVVWPVDSKGRAYVPKKWVKK